MDKLTDERTSETARIDRMQVSLPYNIDSMKIKLLVFVFAITFNQELKSQFSYGDHWYQNPLGFYPLNLHTSMGFFVPAAIAGTWLLLTKKDTSLANKLNLYCEAGTTWGYKYPYTLMPQLNAGINYQIRKHLSLGTEFILLTPCDAFNHTTGFALRPFARFYLFNRRTFQFFFESGGGLVYTVDEFPKPTDQDNRLGLQLNGITKYGLGATLLLSKYFSLSCEIRHLHLSNGNTRGVERNPSHDSNGFFLGINQKLR